MFFPKYILKFVKHLILVLIKNVRSEIRRKLLTSCLFPDLKVGTTFAILKMNGNIARLKHKDKIDARISPSILRNKKEMLLYPEALLTFKKLMVLQISID